MGFTIEDTMTVSGDMYQMKLVAGKEGWSNSIKWILLIEDFTILEHFSGKELVVTTGLGFQAEADLIRLAETLSSKNSSGLIINTGCYIMDIPPSLIAKCDELSLPLMTVPWEVSVSDMIKELTLRISFEDRADETISAALIQAIKNPGDRDSYRKDLLPFYDVDGDFQIVVISPAGLDSLDTVERRRLSYRLQIYLEDITHNGNFFYYDSNFVLMVNDLTDAETDTVVAGFCRRVARRMPDRPVFVGVGSRVRDIFNLHISYQRAISAVRYNRNHALPSHTTGTSEVIPATYFDTMGIDRLLYSVDDTALLYELGYARLEKLINHDRKNPDNDYVNTLRLYLESGGSIQFVADRTYSHRNTIIYRMNRIRELLGSDLTDADERTGYLIACLICGEYPSL